MSKLNQIGHPEKIFCPKCTRLVEYENKNNLTNVKTCNTCCKNCGQKIKLKNEVVASQHQSATTFAKQYLKLRGYIITGKENWECIAYYLIRFSEGKKEEVTMFNGTGYREAYKLVNEYHSKQTKG